MNHQKSIVSNVQTPIIIMALLLVAILLLPGPIARGQVREPEASETARYKIVFDGTWDPSGVPNPHFSGLVGAAHNSSVTFWEVGGLATDGIESMAETGSTNILRDEIGNSSNANLTITGGSIPNAPNQVEISSITIDHDYPLITLVSMIAPSPDWFVGVSGMSLIDEQGEWKNEIVVQLFPYDSGTDSSTTFLHNENDTNPAEPIFRINDTSLFPAGTLGTFTFTRLDGPDPTLTPTSTGTATATPIPATSTATATATSTTIPTETAVPSETPTPIPATETATPTSSVTPTSTATVPPTNETVTPTPTAIPTETAEPTPDVPSGENELLYLPFVVQGN